MCNTYFVKMRITTSEFSFARLFYVQTSIFFKRKLRKCLLNLQLQIKYFKNQRYKYQRQINKMKKEKEIVYLIFVTFCIEKKMLQTLVILAKQIKLHSILS